MAAKKQTHCFNGHALADPNLYYDTKGARRCRACRIGRTASYAAGTATKNGRSRVLTPEARAALPEAYQKHAKEKLAKIFNVSRVTISIEVELLGLKRIPKNAPHNWKPEPPKPQGRRVTHLPGKTIHRCL